MQNVIIGSARSKSQENPLNNICCDSGVYLYVGMKFWQGIPGISRLKNPSFYPIFFVLNGTDYETRGTPRWLEITGTPSDKVPPPISNLSCPPKNIKDLIFRYPHIWGGGQAKSAWCKGMQMTASPWNRLIHYLFGIFQHKRKNNI